MSKAKKPKPPEAKAVTVEPPAPAWAAPVRKPGRPSKLEPLVARSLLQLVEVGATLKQAAATAGVSYHAMRQWLLKGESEDALPEYREFYNLFQQAKAKRVTFVLLKVREQINRGDLSHARMLLSAFDKRFVEKRETKLQGEMDVRVSAERQRLNRLSLEGLREELEKELAALPGGKRGAE